MTTNKYPNADTSPERLAEIERFWFAAETNVFHKPSPMIRDLLAMLQEREHIRKKDNIPVVYRTPPGQAGPLYAIYGTSSISYADVLEAQLHDQRWRRIVDDEPPKRDIVEFSWMDENQQVTALGLWGHPMLMREFPQPLSIPAIWWRPIPPLPTE